MNAGYSQSSVSEVGGECPRDTSPGHALESWR
jgi:hypothetical protein